VVDTPVRFGEYWGRNFHKNVSGLTRVVTKKIIKHKGVDVLALPSDKQEWPSCTQALRHSGAAAKNISERKIVRESCKGGLGDPIQMSERSTNKKEAVR